MIFVLRLQHQSHPSSYPPPFWRMLPVTFPLQLVRFVRDNFHSIKPPVPQAKQAAGIRVSYVASLDCSARAIDQ